MLFKLIELTLFGEAEGQTFSYQFAEGINYFKGKNDSGKTEFYTFLDYMFGANVDLSNKDWYRGTLSSAQLVFSNNNRQFVITRFISNSNKNYFRYLDEESFEEIRLDEYRTRLNMIFSEDQITLKELRTFVEEDIGFRTFTVFNFLGENRQGVLSDFFDKCSRLEYSIKLPPILNYIFNPNTARISELKRHEEDLKAKLDALETQARQNDDIRGRVNHQLKILGINLVFSGTNAANILREIDSLQNALEKSESASKSLAITELEAIYTSLDEQIKRQKNAEYDHKRFVETEVKQKVLLDRLREMVEKRPEYAYLIEPIINLTVDLDKSISFNKYLIQETTTKELQKQRDKTRQQILANKSRFTIYSVSEKTQAATLVREYLSYYNCDFDSDSLTEIQSELRKIRAEIRILQNENNSEKISNLSADITQLYQATSGVSELANYDFRKTGFHISYLKNGNAIQPQILEEEDDGIKQKVNYYTGSMARHTLIQLCGYLGFLRMLIKEHKYPLIPFLVIDHISKTFDSKNRKALGAVLHQVYKDFSKSELQIILFDDKDASDLGITPDFNTNLLDNGKSGFNPFYTPPKEESVDSTLNE